jgi:hypothetical protein
VLAQAWRTETSETYIIPNVHELSDGPSLLAFLLLLDGLSDKKASWTETHRLNKHLCTKLVLQSEFARDGNVL